jgi:uracil-DNA glycosylase
MSEMGDRTNKRLQALKELYDEEHAWAHDDKAVSRNLAAVNANASLAVIGEAVGPRTLRLSGVSYFDSEGNIGRSGKFLDAILDFWGYTVYPPCDVRVPGGTILCRPGHGRKTAYCSDLCPVFPGYQPTRNGQTRIRRPTPQLINSALDRAFLARELSITKPRVILLLGKHAYASIYTHFLNDRPTQSLSTVVREIDRMTFRRYNGAIVIPMLHPSPASPAFLQWIKASQSSTTYERFVRRVTSYLQTGTGE